MELSSRYVGLRSKPYTLTLTARQTMNYAASVFDANPWYLDDGSRDGILAPPMLCVALSWHMSARYADFWDYGDFPLEVFTRQVHYSESVKWHRPMRPGDQLRVSATVAAILPHRAGTHMVVRYAAENGHGEPVFTEFSGAMLRNVRCPDGGRGAESLPDQVKVAEPPEALWEAGVHVHALAAHVYDGCGDIHFPIHTSPAFARQVGLPGTILHGTATLAYAVREILAREAGGDPRRLADLQCLFTDMVPLDSDITIRTTGRHADNGGTRVHFQVLNAAGRKAIRRASLMLRTPATGSAE